jgi:hypothetical protein
MRIQEEISIYSPRRESEMTKSCPDLEDFPASRTVRGRGFFLRLLAIRQPG